MWKHAILALSGLVAAGWAPMAAADAQGTARVGSIVYTLLDLDPNDGIAPSLVFAPSPNIVAGSTSLQYSTFDLNDRVLGTSAEPLHVSVAPIPQLWVSGSLSGRLTDGTLEATVAAHAGSSAYHSGMVGMHSGQIEFVLSPHTRVTFSATFEMEASATGSATLLEYFYAELAMGGYMDDFSSGFGRHGGQVATGDGHPRTLDITQAFSFDMSNTQALPQHGYAFFALDARAYSEQPFSPIPEPGQLPMLGAGLLVLGAWFGRGRRRPAAACRSAA